MSCENQTESKRERKSGKFSKVCHLKREREREREVPKGVITVCPTDCLTDQCTKRQMSEILTQILTPSAVHCTQQQCKCLKRVCPELRLLTAWHFPTCNRQSSKSTGVNRCLTKKRKERSSSSFAVTCLPCNGRFLSAQQHLSKQTVHSIS